MESCHPSEKCPDNEKLSEFAENPVDSETAAHLESCAACRRKVEAYAQIQHLLRASSEPPADLTAKILQAVRKQPRSISAAPRLFPWFRYAAVIAATAVLSIIITQSYSKTSLPLPATGQELATADTPAASVAEQPDAPAAAPAVQPEPRSVATGPLQTVSTDSGAPAINNSSRRYIPGNHVVHVWSTADIGNARKFLEHGLPGIPISWNKTDGILSAQFSIGDQSLQTLVDRLYNAGWELFSPLYPQPGAAAQTILTGRKINYQIKIIPRS